MRRVLSIRACHTRAAAKQLDRVCVVGTGPAGFYASKYLLKANETVQIDMIDMLPTPFGLVRSGVAPDHQDTKNVMNDFVNVAQDERLNFLGNVKVGEDISLQELQRHYNAVVLAYGAEGDRELSIPGSSLEGVLSARKFVEWYNGHPFNVDLEPNLDCKTVVIIGQGNVAIDCARVMTKTAEELAGSDITAYAQDLLATSSIEKVVIVGRRGHVQASFTMKELREVTKLEDTTFMVYSEEIAAGLTESSEAEIKKLRAKKRMNELLGKFAVAEADTASSSGGKSKEMLVRFLLSPVEILPDQADPSRVGAIRFARTRLEGDAFEQRAASTDEFVDIECGLVLASIGYKSSPLPGTGGGEGHREQALPFDARNSVIANTRGRVDGREGLFCTGWVKRGPFGIVGTNIADAKETVETLLYDFHEGHLPVVEPECEGGLDAVRKAVAAQSGKQEGSTVNWEEYERINQFEEAEGAKCGKPREKVVSIDQMLAIAHE